MRVEGRVSSKRNCIGKSNAKNWGPLIYFIVLFWQWKWMEWMSVVIRLKVPIEMHYTVIPMGTSKVNSSRISVVMYDSEVHNNTYSTDFRQFWSSLRRLAYKLLPKCVTVAVTWSDLRTNHHRSAASIPHFTFRIPHSAIYPQPLLLYSVLL